MTDGVLLKRLTTTGLSLVVGLIIANPLATARADEPVTAPSQPIKKSAAAPKPYALPAGVRVIENIPYVPDGDPAQKLDVFLPQTPPATALPAVVWIHGGGWTNGTKHMPDAATLVPDGYIGVSVEYRFKQVALFPAQIQDCQAAIRWLRANAKVYHIDPAHIGVWGESAGGHLVSLLGTAGGKDAFVQIGGNEEQSDRVQAVCDLYGPADFDTVIRQAADDKGVVSKIPFNKPGDIYSELLGVPLNSDPAKGKAVSPVTYVTPGDPPFLILHSLKDPLVPYAQSVEFMDALRNAKVPAWLQTFPGAGHGGKSFRASAVHELTRTFFDKYLKGADVDIKLLPAESLAASNTTPATQPTMTPIR